MVKYKHLIWDWNGTLIDDAWLCFEIFNRQIRHRNLPAVDFHYYRCNFTVPLRKALDKFGLKLSDDERQEFSREFFSEYEQGFKSCQPHRGALDMLERAKAAGLSQSVLSSLPISILKDQAPHFGFDTFMHPILGPDEWDGEGKIALGKRWIKDWHISPKEMLMLGDTDHDADVAEAMGVDCILIPNGLQLRENLKQCKAHVCGDLFEAAGWIFRSQS